MAVPEQEIKEYLAYSFARQSILQLRFNQWTDSFGFIETPRNSDFSPYRGEALLESFRMSEEHLILSKPILESDQGLQWKPIEEFWQMYLNNIFEDVVTEVDKHFVVQELITKSTEWFSTGYRNVGAATFYQRKDATVGQEAREIIRRVEDHLLNQWLQGQVAMIEISGSKDVEHPVKGILAVLREELEERKTKCLAGVSVCEKSINERMDDLDAIEAQYAKIGLDPLGKRNACRRRLTGIRGIADSPHTRPRLCLCLQALRCCPEGTRGFYGGGHGFAAILQNALNTFDKGIKERCQDVGVPDFGKGFVKFYDAEVRRVTKRLVLDRDVQAAQAATVRKAMREQITSQRPTFSELQEQLGVTRLTQVLEVQSYEQSRQAHDAMGLRAQERLFGLSIIEQILAKYPTREARKQFAESVVPQASTLARIDLTEASNAAANPYTGDILRRSLSVIGAGLTASTGAALPPSVLELEVELRSAPKTTLQNFEFVEHRAEVRSLFVSLTNLMPLRTVEHVAFLRRKYEEIVLNGAAPEDRLFLHLEGHGGEYPGLFAPTMEEVRSRGRGALLAAVALGLLVEQTDARTGKRSLTFTETDEFGVPVQVTPYGESLIAACAALDGRKLRLLDAAVESRLRDEEFVHQDKKKALAGKVAAQLQELLRVCGNSPQHPDYLAFTEAYRQLRTRLTAA